MPQVIEPKGSFEGQALDAQFCHVWSIADGKITKFQQYADTEQLSRLS